MTHIFFKGKAYPIRQIQLNDDCCTIATEKLQEAIETGKEAEARRIDERIFFYVPDALIMLPDQQLARYIVQQL